METIKEKPIETADLYYDVSKTRYPKELLQLYLDHLHHLENLYPTEPIREQMKNSLLKAAQLKGGKQEVQRLISEWKHYYSGKKPVMQMLKEVEEQIKEY